MGHPRSSRGLCHGPVGLAGDQLTPGRVWCSAWDLHMRNESALTVLSPQPPFLMSLSKTTAGGKDSKKSRCLVLGPFERDVLWAHRIISLAIPQVESFSVTFDTFQQGLKVQRGGCMKSHGKLSSKNRGCFSSSCCCSLVHSCSE